MRFRRRQPPSYPARALSLEPSVSPAPSRDGLLAPGEAFTPTQPKTSRRLIGRNTELQRVLQALQEDHAHVVLYSERGRGKTSLSNMIIEALRHAGTIVARYTCEAGTTYDDLMRGLMRDLPASLLAARIGAGPMMAEAAEDEDGCVAALPAGELRPHDIVMMPQRLNCDRLVCVLDEFDRVVDPDTRTRLADTIKQLSDADTPLLFVIVGVSENLDQILGQHPSIQRTVQGVHLPLISDRDVAQLITQGGQQTGIQFPAAVVARITILARGMPYMAQLLGLRLAQAVKSRGDSVVLEADFREAVGRLVADAAPSVLALYASLTEHQRDVDMVLALRRIAATAQDQWGRLLVVEAADGSAVVGGQTISASCWRRLQAARVLQPAIAGSSLYLFAERGLLHHALLLASYETVLPQVADAERHDLVMAAPSRPPAHEPRSELARTRSQLASLSHDFGGDAE